MICSLLHTDANAVFVNPRFDKKVPLDERDWVWIRSKTCIEKDEPITVYYDRICAKRFRANDRREKASAANIKKKFIMGNSTINYCINGCGKGYRKLIGHYLQCRSSNV